MVQTLVGFCTGTEETGSCAHQVIIHFYNLALIVFLLRKCDYCLFKNVCCVFPYVTRVSWQVVLVVLCVPTLSSPSFQFLEREFMSLFSLTHYSGSSNMRDFPDQCFLLIIISSFNVLVAYIGVFSLWLENSPFLKCCSCLLANRSFSKQA